MPFCYNCGMQYNEVKRFCGDCGVELLDTATAEPINQESKIDQPPLEPPQYIKHAPYSSHWEKPSEQPVGQQPTMQRPPKVLMRKEVKEKTTQLEMATWILLAGASLAFVWGIIQSVTNPAVTIILVVLAALLYWIQLALSKYDEKARLVVMFASSVGLIVSFIALAGVEVIWLLYFIIEDIELRGIVGIFIYGFLFYVLVLHPDTVEGFKPQEIFYDDRQ